MATGVPKAPAKLCEKCQQAFIPWPRNLKDTESNFRHYDTVIEVQESARHGCGLCIQFAKSGDLLDKSVDSGSNESNLGSFAIYCLNDGFDPEAGVLLTLDLFRYNDPVAKTGYEKHVWRAKAFLMPGIQQAVLSPSEGKSNTRDTLSMGEDWLQTCNSSHACKSKPNAGAEKHLLPTRLIVTDGEYPRLLHDTSELPGTTPYSTLSHCWGTHKILTLTKGNLWDLIGRIPTAQLSRTFQNAIEIARYLGFKYIWIDSLCIVQDDADDWKRESKRMGDVYGGSNLNIAATSASDGTRGCFFDREDSWRMQILLGNTESSEGILHECFGPDMLEQARENIPLLTRAWVVQERFLSPRTLHFTNKQIFWVCKETTACEIWPEGIPRVKLYLESSIDLPKGDWLARKSWPKIVQQYSACNLTFGRDKLVAISALAQLIQNETRDEYIAGMWREDLVHQLCWSIGRFGTGLSHKGGRLISSYVAPSWSWASNAEEIIYFDPTIWEVTETYVQSEDVAIVLASPDYHLGEILSAKLRLSFKYLKEITVIQWPSSGVNASVKIGEQFTKWGIAFDSEKGRGEQKKFLAFYLPVFAIRNGPPHGLLLERTGGQKGEYRRIGKVSEWMQRNWASESFLPKAEDCAQVTVGRDGQKTHFMDII